MENTVSFERWLLKQIEVHEAFRNELSPLPSFDPPSIYSDSCIFAQCVCVCVWMDGWVGGCGCICVGGWVGGWVGVCVFVWVGGWVGGGVWVCLEHKEPSSFYVFIHNFSQRRTSLVLD